MNELEIVRLEEINKQLKYDYEDKCKLVKNLEDKLLGTCSME